MTYSEDKAIRAVERKLCRMCASAGYTPVAVTSSVWGTVTLTFTSFEDASNAARVLRAKWYRLGTLGESCPTVPVLGVVPSLY